MHSVRVDRISREFAGYDYDIVGRDAHVDNFVKEAQDEGILRRDFVGVITRDLRVVMHRA